MKSIDHPTFGNLKMVYDIAEINMHWWAGVIEFPSTNTNVAIELHATPVGPTEVHEHSYSRLLSGYHALIQSAIEYDPELCTPLEWKLETIVLFVNGHIDLRIKSDDREYCIHANQNALYLTPTEAELC